MRPAIIAALLVLSLVALAPSSGQDAPKDDGVAWVATTSLPFHPFGHCKPGDWSVRVFTATREGKDPRTHAAFYTIKAVTNTQVTVEIGYQDAEGHEGEMERVYSLEDTTFEGCYLEPFEGDTLTEPKVAAKKSKETIDGRELEGYRLSYRYTTATKVTFDRTLFLSPEVPGGVVLARIVETSKEGTKGDTIAGKLAGFGTEGKVTFGKSIEDVKKAIAK